MVHVSSKTMGWVGLTIALNALAPAALCQVPTIISYQGVLSASGSNYSGVGQFEFALVNSNGSVTFWSNDGSSSGGSEPNLPVTNFVRQGLFSVMLGDSSVSNMTPIPWGVFTNSDVRLRIWFGAGASQPVLLSPDQKLASVGFAMMAANVPNGAVGSAQLASNAVTAQSISNGAITSALLALNAVTTPAIMNSSVTSAKLAPQSVTASALAEGAVTAASLGLDSVTSAALAPGAVTSSSLAAGSVTSAAIASRAVGLSQVNFQLGYINAQNPPYGAAGNGTNDDAAAIQTALNAVGGAGGGVVFLPRGNYLISSNLVVPPETSLVGVWRSPTAWSQNLGTTLLAVAGAGSASGPPFISLEGPNSVLDGITVYYPNQVQNNPPTPYPWAIQAGGGDNVTVQNVLLVNPYQGIDLATHTSGRHLIRGVYGQPLVTGIQVDQCYDIGRIMDIHFWPFWSYSTNIQAFQSANAVSFDFMRTDWEVVQDIFSYGYGIGARFRASTNGAMSGEMSNVNFDNVDIGLQVIATASDGMNVQISNLTLANDGGGTNHIGIEGLPGTGQLAVTGACLGGQIYQPVSWNNSGLLSLSMGRFLNWQTSLQAINIISGQAILQGNYFSSNLGTAIRTGNNTTRALIVGNMLFGNTVAAGPNTYSSGNQP